MEPSRSELQLCRRLAALVGLASAVFLCMFASADIGRLDAAELGGAAVALGVPHPSGFSLDMLLLKAASFWPLGSLAFRENLCVSALAGAATGCIAYASMRLARQCRWLSPPSASAAASVSAAVLLGSTTVLDAALCVEVYASSLLCVSVAGLLADAEDKGSRRAVWPLFGLALGAHITAPLLLAPAALVGWLRGTGRSRPAMFAMAGAFASCALVIIYLPLASLRDTAFDWGDPETLTRWLRHLSAARIREAYAGALFTPDTLPRLRLLEQLGERPEFLLPAAVGALGVLREQPQRLLVIGALLSLDLAYAIWINPMGVTDRQVGHVSIALIALLAGCGAGLVVELVRSRSRYAARVGAAAIAGGCVWSAGHALSQRAWSDGYAVSERFGAGSPLSALPPRAVYVCESDSACASGLFALYAEGTRPDLDIVPAQHLWDPSVLRRLRGLPLTAAAGEAAWPEPRARAGTAQANLRELFRQGDLRPVFVERTDHVPATGAQALDLSHVPWIGLGVRGAGQGASPQAQLASLQRARFGDTGPQTSLARELWASAHETLGTVYLRTAQGPLAVAELARAVQLTPLRSAARSNLGIALEQGGDLPAALEQTARAVELDPRRPTPWVNLTRLLLRVQGPEAARAALLNASRFAVRDPRLDELAAELPPRAAKDLQGTTRK